MPPRSVLLYYKNISFYFSVKVLSTTAQSHFHAPNTTQIVCVRFITSDTILCLSSCTPIIKHENRNRDSIYKVARLGRRNHWFVSTLLSQVRSSSISPTTDSIAFCFRSCSMTADGCLVVGLHECLRVLRFLMCDLHWWLFAVFKQTYTQRMLRESQSLSAKKLPRCYFCTVIHSLLITMHCTLKLQ